jgi:predicted protein tyrosine phosphatase
MNAKSTPEMGRLSDFLRVSALFAGRVYLDLLEFLPTHVDSLLDASIDESKIPSFGGISSLQRRFDDGDAPVAAPLTREIMHELVDYLETWPELLRRGESARMLVHCHMGASRSTAVALVALSILRGENRERQAFEELLSITNKPWPNINVVRLADDILARRGRLVTEVDRYRAAHPNRLAAYDLSVTDVVRAIRASNNEVEGRLLEFAGREYMVRARGYLEGVSAASQ